MLGWLAGKIYEALFTDVESGAKKTHILVKTVFTITILVCVGIGLYQSVAGLIMVVIVMLLSGLASIIPPVLIISSIPALWFSLSNAILLSLNGEFNHIAVIEVYVRALTASAAILLLIAALNPYELSRILYRLGLRKQSLIPIMVWRLMPLALRDVVEAYGIQKLKNQALWKSIAISTASMLEKSDMILESNGLKLEVGVVEPLPYEYSMKYTLLFSAATMLVILLILFY